MSHQRAASKTQRTPDYVAFDRNDTYKVFAVCGHDNTSVEHMLCFGFGTQVENFLYIYQFLKCPFEVMLKWDLV
jgi:hypothetical protein